MANPMVSIDHAPALVYNGHIRHQRIQRVPLHGPVTGDLIEATALNLEEIDAMPGK